MAESAHPKGIIKDIIPKSNKTAAEMSGVEENATGDLSAFLTALVTNSATLVIFFIIAGWLRLKYPLVYSGNVVAKDVPFIPEESLFGWWQASHQLTLDDAVEYAGLDQALLLTFSELGMRILFLVGAPMVLIVGPIHCFFGGNRSGDDHLSKWGIANVVDGHPWIYWMHAAIVWLVVITTQKQVFEAMKLFLVRRNAWLKGLPAPRSMTVLVQGIPEEKCSDSELKNYFNTIFGGDVVEQAVVIKDTTVLLEKVAIRDAAQLSLDKANFSNATADIATYKQELEDAEKDVKAERTKVKALAAAQVGGVNLSNGFVTFKKRRDAELAKMMTYTPDAAEFEVHIPPDPTDIIYSDLQRDPTAQKIRDILGYTLLAGVFWAYMPCVLGISYYSSLFNLAKTMPFLAEWAKSEATVAIWDGMVASMALQLFMSFVPTFFVLIFLNFFVLKAQVWVQARIQSWYFYFQVVFVLLVTGIGSSLVKTMEVLVADPTAVLEVLARTLPTATHFYLNYLPLQWVTHAQNMLRMVQLFKFKAFAAIFEESQAKKQSEPEDQDYYGLGSRSSRFAFMLVLPLCLVSLTPLIAVLGFINFFVCRRVYGYLTVFAETRKPGLGGVFYCTQLHHVQQGMFLYIIIMAGVLLQRDVHSYPSAIAASSIIYMYWSYSRFKSQFRWEALTFQELTGNWNQKKRQSRRNTYEQYELVG